MTPEQRRLYVVGQMLSGLELLVSVRTELAQLDGPDAQRALTAIVTLRQIATKHRPAGLKVRTEPAPPTIAGSRF